MTAALPMPVPLSEGDFNRLIRLAPLVAVDLIIRNRDGKILVAQRNDEPARGYLFNPGGCVFKGEPIEAAFGRIMERETGRRVPYEAARFRGFYQHFYRATRFGYDGSGTHYVVLAHDVALKGGRHHRSGQTHSTYRWLSESEILASPEVHEYTKDYFRPARRVRHTAM
jgi:colanic acid biosynthesis protein WcaH